MTDSGKSMAERAPFDVFGDAVMSVDDRRSWVRDCLREVILSFELDRL